MGKCNFWSKCLRRKPKPDTRRVAAIEIHVPVQQAPLPLTTRPQPVQTRASPQPDPLITILNAFTSNTETYRHRTRTDKIKPGKVKVTSTFDVTKIKSRDFKPERKEKFRFRYSCPVCFRYFNHIFQTTCCKHYLCKNCIDDFNRFAADKEIEHIVCHFCKVPDLAVVDVNMNASIRKYTDSSVGSPGDTYTHGFKAKVFDSQEKLSKGKSKKSKKSPIKNASAGGYATDEEKSKKPRKANNSFAEGVSVSERKMSSRHRSYLSDGDELSNQDFESIQNEEEKRHDSSIGKSRNSPGSKAELENANDVSADSIFPHRAISVISEKDSEEMTVSADFSREKDIPNIFNRHPLEGILAQLNHQFAPAQDNEEEEDDDF